MVVGHGSSALGRRGSNHAWRKEKKISTGSMRSPWVHGSLTSHWVHARCTDSALVTNLAYPDRECRIQGFRRVSETVSVSFGCTSSSDTSGGVSDIRIGRVSVSDTGTELI